MPDVLSRQFRVDDLDPQAVAIAVPILQKYEAAALRVAANHNDPRNYPLPKGKKTPEALLATRFRKIATIRADVAGRAGDNALAMLSMPRPVARLQQSVNIGAMRGDNQSVNLLAAPSVAFGLPNMSRILDRHYQFLGMQHTSVGAAVTGRSVRFTLIRVACIDETNGFLGSEAGDDEIYITGTSIDESANTAKIPQRKIGDMSDGDVITLSPAWQVWSQAVGGGTEYPKHYATTLIMFEHDHDDLSDSAEALYRQIVEAVKKKLDELIKAGAEYYGVGAAAPLIQWLSHWVIDKLADYLLRVWGDDFFKPRVLELVIPSATALMQTESQVFHFKGPGEYAVRYRWSVVTNRQVNVG
ncbi:hypothetical protein J2X85_001417 [Microbacterium trichothecenolyticum]|uniref:hypothetical protein n=1 Tax=Microbacterium trichothecenolyticum TaxID=69370 RepID=UPI002860DD53|nr:hypothetical protein [Microbacterium trichothecenolyticum]MDR7184394.1 hypothetical protein [Microbacterium trichothecenolyticum]